MQFCPGRFFMNKKDERLYDVFNKRNGFARTKDILEAGIHRRDIKRLRDEEQIVRVKRGLYRLSEIPLISNQGFVDVASAVPDGVICLLSALSYYELTTFNPSAISMALHRGSRKPKIEYPPVEFYYFSTKQFEVGIDTITIDGHKVRIYSPEKTICDCIRYRNKLGFDVVKEGLTEHLKRKNRNLEKLLEYTEVCRVRPLLQEWLNVIV